MNTKQAYLMVLAGALLLGSCQNHSEKGAEHHADSHEVQHTDHGHIRLNQNEKWMVNEEMKPFIAEAESALEAFIASGSREYRALASTLEEKNAGLIKSCTMDGESHEELHKWLHPHMELINNLGEAADEQSAQSIVKALEKSFATYHEHFQ